MFRQDLWRTMSPQIADIFIWGRAVQDLAVPAAPAPTQQVHSPGSSLIFQGMLSVRIHLTSNRALPHSSNTVSGGYWRHWRVRRGLVWDFLSQGVTRGPNKSLGQGLQIWVRARLPERRESFNPACICKSLGGTWEGHREGKGLCFWITKPDPSRKAQIWQGL